jgi:hypothetical protein
VLALRKAEQLFPIRVQRNPLVREVLGELLVRSRRDAVGRELRGMACRAGLPLTTRLRWRRSVRGYTPPSRLGPHAWALTLGPSRLGPHAWALKPGMVYDARAKIVNVSARPAGWE